MNVLQGTPGAADAAPLDIDRLRTWIGRTESRSDVVSATSVQGLAAALDRDGREAAVGDALPPCWHWLYAFTPIARQSALGVDGHPRRGGFLPPVPLPRRMWAGSQVEFRRPLTVGDTLHRRSTVADLTGKAGRSGSLVFARVLHEYGDGSQVALIEHQDIVYRENPTPGEPGPAAVPAPSSPAFARTVQPDATLLFRYSALTHNAHRIHYDRPYAIDVEGYPGLVVQGPLIATLLLDLLRIHRSDPALASFRFRAVRPLFDTAPFRVCGRHGADGKAVQLWAEDADGALAMDATAVLA